MGLTASEPGLRPYPVNPEKAGQAEYLAYVQGLSPQSIEEARSKFLRADLSFSEEEAYRKIAELVAKDPVAYYCLRKLILDLSWGFCQQGMALNPRMTEGEIARHALYHSGSWQALMGLFHTLSPQNLEDQAAGGRVDRVRKEG